MQATKCKKEIGDEKRQGHRKLTGKNLVLPKAHENRQHRCYRENNREGFSAEKDPRESPGDQKIQEKALVIAKDQEKVWEITNL